MFIARSARRVRFARVAFLIGGVLPCVALAAWAVHLRSPAHRESLRVRWQQAIGLPLQVTAVEHLRPGVVRGRGCVLAAQDGGARLAVPLVEIERTPRELRLHVDRVDLDADAAGLLAGLAAEWLAREARFPCDCVIDVGELRWDVGGGPGIERSRPAGRLRLECVARDGTRAIRCVFGPADGGGSPAEVRIVRSAGTGDGRGLGRHVVTAACPEPLPLAIVVRLLGPAALPALSTGAAAVSGTLHTIGGDGRWTGQLAARLEGLDLASCAAAAGWRAAGLAEVVVRRLEWDEGRISFADAEVHAGPGAIDRGLLEALVRGLGCRPREGLLRLPGNADPRFDAAGMLLRVDGRGAEILPPARMRGSVAVLDGQALLDPPAAVVPIARFADWLAGATGNTGPPPMWLRHLLPRESQAARPPARTGSESHLLTPF